MSKQFAIVVVKGAEIANKAALRRLFDLKDGRYLVEVSKADKRSNPQNNYYWQILTLYIQPALLNAGWEKITSKEAAHEFVSQLFLTVREKNIQTLEIMPRVKSTTELTKEEFNIYLEDIWRWAAQYLSIAIPSPGEKLLINYD